MFKQNIEYANDIILTISNTIIQNIKFKATDSVFWGESDTLYDTSGVFHTTPKRFIQNQSNFAHTFCSLSSMHILPTKANPPAKFEYNPFYNIC